MEPGLMKLILGFEQETAEMLREFQRRSGFKSRSEMRQAGLGYQGYIPGRPRIIYRFHGIGLRLRIGQRRIDFDFGHGGRTDGFDAWRLWLFAKDRPAQFPEFQDRESIEAALAEARKAGEIGTPFLDHHDRLEYRLPIAVHRSEGD